MGDPVRCGYCGAENYLSKSNVYLTRAELEDLLRRARDMGYDAGLWGKARPDIATLLEGLDREDTD